MSRMEERMQSESTPSRYTSADQSPRSERSVRDSIDEAKAETREAVSDLQDQVAAIADQQRLSLARGTATVSRAVSAAADSLERDGQIGMALYADQLAGTLSDWGNSVRQKDLRSLAHEVQSVAQRQPALFVGGAALIGFALTRFLKAKSERASLRADDSIIDERFESQSFDPPSSHGMARSFDTYGEEIRSRSAPAAPSPGPGPFEPSSAGLASDLGAPAPNPTPETRYSHPREPVSSAQSGAQMQQPRRTPSAPPPLSNPPSGPAVGRPAGLSSTEDETQSASLRDASADDTLPNTFFAYGVDSESRRDNPIPQPFFTEADPNRRGGGK